MIPISLSIEGLYSYKEAQTIDFTSLTSSGLFGIFGAVGSGKSSILEAMMFVLYDKSDRLNYSGDNRYYNMLNLQRDELMLDFTFYSGGNNLEKYRFRFLARRNKKDYEKVEVKERTFYHWADNNWQPLDHINDATPILGMSYQNFMQTIIIPQGKFREFVDHSAGERTKMLKELFHLNKFDLSQKTNTLLKKNDLNISKLNGRLQELGEVDPAEIALKEEELKEIKVALYAADLQCKASKAEEEKLKLLKSLFAQIGILEEKKVLLENQGAEFSEKERQLYDYEKAFTYLKEKINVRETSLFELEKRKKNQTFLRNKLGVNQKALDEAGRAYLAAKEAYDNRDQIKQKCNDLETIIGLKEVQGKSEKLKNAIEFEKQQKEDAALLFQQLKETLNQTEHQLIEIEAGIPDAAHLQQAYHWYIRQQDLQMALEKHQTLQKKHGEKLLQLEREKTKLSLTNDGFQNYEDILSGIKMEEDKATLIKSSINQEIQALEVQQKLAGLISNVKEGEPCPVCGSLHHPATKEAHSVDDILVQKQAEFRDLEKRQNKLSQLQTKVQQLSLEYKSQQNLLQEKESEVKEAEEKLSEHQQTFNWEMYKNTSLEQLDQIRNNAKLKQEQAESTKEKIRQLKAAKNEKEEVLEKLSISLTKAENEICATEATRETLINQLKQLPFEKFKKFGLNQLQESLEKGLNQLAETTSNHEAATQNLQQLKQDDQKLDGQLQSEGQNIDQLSQKIKSLDDDIQRLLQDKGFTNLGQVKQILASAINLEQERKALEQYHRELHSTRTALENHYKEADGLKYDVRKHQELVSELEKFDQLIEELRKQAALQNKEIEDLKKRLETKNECEKVLENLKQREVNLKELRRLFMGNGFVRYVSSIYLQDLCKAANQRFFKLTKNNLSLELNQEEEFVVRDYLNNGKTRLLKTLSGGQTFQAALCLALALAENVKSINKADQSFFFLDEGFGALDKESLRVVFETLKTLRKENRIVGIISHVEELQQEIDVYLHVTNDKDKGSMVSYSWK